MIRLEYFTPEDFPLLIEWIDSEELLTNWAGSQFKFPLSTEKLQHYLKKSNDFEHSGTLIYKAVDVASGKNVGHISLSVIDRENRSARITRVLVGNTGERGRGLGTEIIKSMLKMGFEDLNLHRMSLGVYDFNEAGIKCYKNCGFSIDGVLRDIKRRPDSFWSIVEMSILEDEYNRIYKS
ncbi:GNAT family N-acetyltransferase [Daejeonella oryzae]|uniref:GNAT family N-acetyltransferase n=1 Tax=Daejeonella oryzae TaxID=1122943 RepID=UPI0003F5E9F6|nr:GNAT family protein [Daejeonella oryzae]